MKTVAEKKLVRLPHEFLQGEKIFTASEVASSPWRIQWKNEYGEWRVSAPRTPLSWDLLVYLGCLHLAQKIHENEWMETVEERRDAMRARVVLPVSELCDTLHVDRRNFERDAWSSIEYLSEVSVGVRFAKPNPYIDPGYEVKSIGMPGLLGDVKLRRKLGRGGSEVVVHPMAWFLQKENRLTCDFEIIRSLKANTARIIAFFLTSRPESRFLTAAEWSTLVSSQYARVGDFKRRALLPALDELGRAGYTVVHTGRGDGRQWKVSKKGLFTLEKSPE